MRIIETKVYTFNELSETAQQKAIEKLYDINVSYDWWDFTYEDASNVGLKISGFDIWRGSDVNIEFTDGDATNTAHLIEKEHGNKCSTYITAKRFLSKRDRIINTAEKDENGEFADESEVDSLLDECDNNFLKLLAINYLKLLKDNYDYLISEEAIKETIEANEYEFTEDGTLISI